MSHKAAWLPAAALVAGCSVLIAACGSTSTGSGQTDTNATNGTSLVKYSDCMRSHGVPTFPDPSTTESGNNSFGIDGYTFNLPADLNTQSPAYQSGAKTCAAELPSGGGAPKPGLLAKAKQAALVHARCMRAHGVPNFPDPNVSSNGQGVTVGSGGPGLSPRSPAFQQAQRICQGSH
ncbi:MAG TPA: hypothetical protein VMF57_10585 [Solirubrobacteraceae bacterium]|nr:hypothetical protein [Solirubrobacteraceae bacterium]